MRVGLSYDLLRLSLCSGDLYRKRGFSNETSLFYLNYLAPPILNNHTTNIINNNNWNHHNIIQQQTNYTTKYSYKLYLSCWLVSIVVVFLLSYHNQ